MKSKEILRSGDNTYLWIEGLDVKRNNDVSKMYNALQFGREHRESTWHTFDNCANCASRWAAESSSVAALVTEERRQINLKNSLKSFLHSCWLFRTFHCTVMIPVVETIKERRVDNKNVSHKTPERWIIWVPL